MMLSQGLCARNADYHGVSMCRREAAHIFRPFPGYVNIRLLQKDSVKTQGKVILGFVEFIDVQSAVLAMQSLHGYQIDLVRQLAANVCYAAHAMILNENFMRTGC